MNNLFVTVLSAITLTGCINQVGYTPDIADNDVDSIVDGLDNCVDTKNPDQLDHDDDGTGTACDSHPHEVRFELVDMFSLYSCAYDHDDEQFLCDDEYSYLEYGEYRYEVTARCYIEGMGKTDSVKLVNQFVGEPIHDWDISTKAWKWEVPADEAISGRIFNCQTVVQVIDITDEDHESEKNYPIHNKWTSNTKVLGDFVVSVNGEPSDFDTGLVLEGVKAFYSFSFQIP